MINNPSPASIKKEWKSPELILIGQNNVTTGPKNHPQVKESTGTQSGGSFSTPAHFHWFIGTKLSAIS